MGARAEREGRQRAYGARNYEPQSYRSGGYGQGGYGRAFGEGGYGQAPPSNGQAEPWERSVGNSPPLDSGWRDQQDEVRAAVRQGRHISLARAIEAVRRRSPGHELDAGLETGPDGRPVYRLRWAGQDGRRQDYLVDAGSGAVIGVLGGR